MDGTVSIPTMTGSPKQWPACTTHPSDTDRKVLRLIRRTPEARVKEPVMIVVGLPIDAEPAIAAYRLEHRLRRMTVSLEPWPARLLFG
jgi:hypothetical protein